MRTVWLQRGAYILALAGVFVTSAAGGTITVAVRDGSGTPVADAVVYAVSASGNPSGQPKKAIVTQQNREFLPHVTAIQVGTAVHFPNLDPVKHHIYSISPAKQFELPLYSGTPPNPIVFDKPGVVTLGCNIHDWMIGYICVLDTPWFGVTGPYGQIQLKDVPSGSYDVEVWQPRLKNSSRPRQRVTVGGEKPAGLIFEIGLKPEIRLARRPPESREAYP
jgi:plastocyanin